MQISVILLENELSQASTKVLLNKTSLTKLPSLPSKHGEMVTFFDQSNADPIILLKINTLAIGKNTAYIRKALVSYKGDLAVSIINLDEVSDAVAENVLLGFFLWEYDFASLKSTKDSAKKVVFDKTVSKKLEKSVRSIAEAMKTAMHIVDLPPNVKNPDFLVGHIQSLGKKYDLKVDIISKKELISKGFGALLSVGQASEFGTYLATISYQGNKKKGVDHALIGKGVTFDTGGISIKPSTNMHYMKSDLGGAAAVIGAMQLIATQKPNVNVVAILPIVENAVNSNATRPGDVVVSYSKKTIEIIDTDAEGRLILVDAISYTLDKIKPTNIIDLATLTGSSVMTFGSQYAAMFTKNQQIATTLFELGEHLGEKVWNMPLDEEYGEMMHSDIADIKNFHGRPYAGAITAAKFLEFFTENHENWVHLDIAGVAFVDSDLVKSKIASAFGVRLLAEYVKK